MSVQLDAFLEARASGSTVETAANFAGFSLTEARLTEKAIKVGEIELPRAGARAHTRESEPTKEGNVAQGTVAGDELQLLVERIERLHEERQGIADDIKDVFAEAKSRGFDTKAMKQVMKLRKMEPHARDEAEAILGSYLSALGMSVEHAIALAA